MREKHKIKCPYCKAEQDEPLGAVSTYCHACKRHIPIQGNRRRRAAHVPQNTRVVVCRQCGYTDKIVADAMSTQCENCSTYLDLRSHVIKGKSNQKIATYGDVTFLPGSSYEGPPVRASRIFVAGKVSAILQADMEMEIQDGARLNNPIDSPIIRIGPGAEVAVNLIRTRTLELASKLRAHEVTASEQIVILPGGMLIAQRVSTRFIEVQPGGVLLADLEVSTPDVTPEDLRSIDIEGEEEEDEAQIPPKKVV